ncbi:murein biosynthesis integral membrane protein MurJ [Leucobacter coleopterorum]|uniref:Murein biosynthesis integral membrane protein MurJ n=1 Tax=Leucobacter coleopterorum TaxID=2714933 RepID=A0ABX6K0S4_9MICO|nr:murein biosynthesis integral membrane protein MurJ [Leucobacter coleopterorum]QIM18814.1 murein biosynthesis integral membrane protein MurJ [Leucobacter coleopterorum]
MAASLMRSSAVMASGTMVSRVLGFAKAMLLVFAIGMVESKSADAFANGNLLPNTLYMIMAGGMINAVLVPQIVKAAKGADGGAGYINKILTLVLVALAAGTAIVMAVAPWIMELLTPGWGDPQRALAIAFAYWCLPQIVFYGLYTVLGEVLNARSVFGPFTWAPVLNNVVAIVGIVVFVIMFGSDRDGTRTPEDWTPIMIAVLAGSATLGVIAQAVVLFASWRRVGIRFRPDFRWRGTGLSHTGKIAGWSLATITVMQLGGLITQRVINLATGDGASAAAMQNAWLIFMLPHSVIAVSLGTAYFTRLAESGQSGRLAAFRADFSASARQISLVMVLAAVAIFSAAPFISYVFSLGSSPQLVEQFAIVLQCYMVGLAAYSFLFVVQRSFYALSDTRTPFFFTTVQIVLLVALTLCLVVLPKDLIGPAYGVVFGFSIILQAVLAVVLLRRKIGFIDATRILASFSRYVIAAIPALVVGLLLTVLIGQLLPNYGIVLALVFAAVDAALVAIVYIVGLRLLKSPELAELTNFVSSKLGRNRS